jgi:hypothetical protein
VVSPKEPTVDCESTALGKTFDAWTVENEVGILVEFTDILADHLRLVKNDTTVLVFHHVSFLEAQESG